MEDGSSFDKRPAGEPRRTELVSSEDGDAPVGSLIFALSKTDLRASKHSRAPLEGPSFARVGTRVFSMEERASLERGPVGISSMKSRRLRSREDAECSPSKTDRSSGEKTGPPTREEPAPLAMDAGRSTSPAAATRCRCC